jgi:hypothetical protein
MKEEKNLMKYLKINDNKAYYYKSDELLGEVWIEVDKMNKDDLLVLLNQAITGDFEMDEFNEGLLQNKAHQIVYKNIYQKFVELIENKARFADESANTYKEALDKYRPKENL